MSQMTNQTNTTNPTPQNDAVDLETMFASFDVQGPALKELFRVYTEGLHHKVAALTQLVTEQEEELKTAKKTGKLSLTPTDMQRFAATVAKAAAPAPKNKIEAVMPEKFDGKPDRVDPFLSAVELYFTLRPDVFQNDLQRVLWILQLFTKDAEPWARSKVKKLTAGEVVYTSVDELVADIRQSFANFSREDEARNNLQAMRYSSKEGLGSFINKFRAEADSSNFDNKTLIFFLRGTIPEDVQIQIASVNQGKIPDTAEEWYKLCHLLDSIRTGARQALKTTTTPSSRPYHQSRPNPPSSSAPSISTTTPNASTSGPAPMDIDGHKRQGGPLRCYKCGEEGHIKRNCPTNKDRYLRASDMEEMFARVMKTFSEKKDFPEGQQ